jgi:hypothetical protein
MMRELDEAIAKAAPGLDIRYLPEDSDHSQAQLVLMAMASRAGEMFDVTFERRPLGAVS